MTHIQVYMPAGEAREAKMRAAIEADKQGRFVWGGNASDLPGDVRFRYQETFRERCNGIENPDVVGFHRPREYPIGGPKVLDVEIKDFSEKGNSDYLASILNGHLWEQCLAARELGEPMIIVVLGDDRDVNEAIKIAASRNHRVDAKKLFQYFQMVDGFEANCIGLGIQVWRLKTDPWKRLLLRVRKILEGGDISGFAPKPSDGERQVVGLSILAGRGVGPKMAANILQRYNLCLVLRDGFCGDLVDCEGIGPKRAEMIRKNLEVIE